MDKKVLRYQQWLVESESAEGADSDNKVEGGLADGKTAEDIAAKHDVSVDDINVQIEKGCKVESEHTEDQAIAKEIAMDHLMEDPKYYDKLATIENPAGE